MEALEKIFFINVGANGTFANSGHFSSSPADVEQIFTFLEEKDIEKLLIYFHGGLVSEKSGLKAATVMKEHFASTDARRHAVSFVWETGPAEVVMQNIKNLKELTGKGAFDEIVKFVTKLVAKKLGLDDAKGGGTYLSDETIAIEKQKIAPFEDLDKSLDARGGTPLEIDEEDENYSTYYAKLETEAKGLINAEGSDELKYEQAEGDEIARGGMLFVAKVVAQIAFAVLKRYFKKTHHDFYPTIMEEAFRKLYVDKIGGWGWKQIKDKSGEMFSSNSGLSDSNLHAGTHFLSLLETHLQKRTAEGKKLDIELIGHSAGAIAVCNLLEATGQHFSGITYNNVFFLAPACRTDFFLQKGFPAQEKGLFKHFKMFTMEESNEKKDHCIPFTYTHSLLYMVSGLFEEEVDAKIMGLHEQLKATGRYETFDELKKLNQYISNNKLILSTDLENADESLRCSSLKHGDFDNDELTLTAILKSI